MRSLCLPGAGPAQRQQDSGGRGEDTDTDTVRRLLRPRRLGAALARGCRVHEAGGQRREKLLSSWRRPRGTGGRSFGGAGRGPLSRRSRSRTPPPPSRAPRSAAAAARRRRGPATSAPSSRRRRSPRTASGRRRERGVTCAAASCSRRACAARVSGSGGERAGSGRAGGRGTLTKPRGAGPGQRVPIRAGKRAPRPAPTGAGVSPCEAAEHDGCRAGAERPGQRPGMGGCGDPGKSAPSPPDTAVTRVTDCGECCSQGFVCAPGPAKNLSFLASRVQAQGRAVFVCRLSHVHSTYRSFSSLGSGSW